MDKNTLLKYLQEMGSWFRDYFAFKNRFKAILMNQIFGNPFGNAFNNCPNRFN